MKNESLITVGGAFAYVLAILERANLRNQIYDGPFNIFHTLKIPKTLTEISKRYIFVQATLNSFFSWNFKK